MWAKQLLVAGFAVLSAAAAPVDYVRQAYTGDAWRIEVQDRRGGGRDENLRDLREIVAELRARYGGELVDARPVGNGTVYEIVWRDRNGAIHHFRVDRRR